MRKLGPSIIVCGAREIEPHHWDITDLMATVLRGYSEAPHEILSGGCRGVDAAGERWAAANHVPVRRFPADWSLGPKAGPLRNQAMVDEADAVVAIAYPDSRGTKDCVRRAIAKGIPVAMLVLPRRKGS